MTALEWKIYYGDGSTFSSADGPPQAAPGYNVQCVAVRDEKVGRQVLHGGDFYIYRDGVWYCCDQFGMFDQLIEMGVLKTGRALSRKEYEAVLTRATEDPALPRKSARLKGDRRFETQSAPT